MTADSIMLVATKCTVLAFERETGRRLWQTALKSGWTSQDFVTLVADERRVFATTKGELFCLDLFTGSMLWTDGMTGLGYGIASLALPGSLPARVAGGAEHMRRADEERRRSTNSNQQ
jgi:outer membrane protein assembly factor BamB